MLNHFSVSNLKVISNDPNDIGMSFQVALVDQESDGSNRTKVFKVKNSEQLTIKINELINLLESYNPTADSLEQAKFIKLNQIANQWALLELAGWDSGQGFSLGVTSSDVALIVGVFTLAKEASALGLPLPSIVSMSNTPISFSSISDMTELLLRYGEARANMTSEFAARRKAVHDALTIEEVGSI